MVEEKDIKIIDDDEDEKLDEIYEDEIEEEEEEKEEEDEEEEPKRKKMKNEEINEKVIVQKKPKKEKKKKEGLVVEIKDGRINTYQLEGYKINYHDYVINNGFITIVDKDKKDVKPYIRYLNQNKKERQRHLYIFIILILSFLIFYFTFGVKSKVKSNTALLNDIKPKIESILDIERNQSGSGRTLTWALYIEEVKKINENTHEKIPVNINNEIEKDEQGQGSRY